MLIIIEGPDNTGKTSLARHLQEVFDLDYIHCSKPKTDYPFQEYMDLIGDIRKPTVIDRIYLSEYVYSKLWRDGCTITDKQFELLDLEAMSKFEHCFVIHAYAPDDVIKKRCEENNEQLLQPEQIPECSKLFRDIMKKVQIPVVNYNSFLEEPKDVVEKLCQMGLSIG